MSSSATNWSVKEVGDWLSSLNMSQYRSFFEALRIDGSLLLEINEQDLETDLNVSIRLHRVKIMDGLKRLKDLYAPVEEVNVRTINVNGAIPRNLEVSEAHCDVLVLKAIEGPLLNDLFIVGSAGATLGRHTASNDIVIGESFVSRRHCDVKYCAASNQFLLEDVGSTTGTFLMLQHPTPLSLNMLFQMGLSEFKVENIKYSPNGSMISADLFIFEGPARQSSLKITRDGLTIGREASNSLMIREDSQMSSHHGEINLVNGVFTLSDLNSTNKTWIRLSYEGERSQPYSLVVGDVIKVGITVLMVLEPESIPHPAESKPVSEETACKICYTRETNVALYPCGHVLCHPCARKCKKCPLCRALISDVVVLNRQ